MIPKRRTSFAKDGAGNWAPSRSRWRWALWLAIAVAVYVWVALLVFSVRHPDMAEMRKLLHFWDAMCWRVNPS